MQIQFAKNILRVSKLGANRHKYTVLGNSLAFVSSTTKQVKEYCPKPAKEIVTLGKYNYFKEIM